MYLLKTPIFQTLLFLNFSKPDHNNPSPRTGPQGFPVTHYDCEKRTNHNKSNKNINMQ